MSIIIQAQSLPIKARQTIEVCQYTKFLAVELDIRHNNCLLWTLQDDEKKEKPAKEDAEIIMLTLDEELEPPSANYIGNIKTNAGVRHVFGVRASEKLFTK